MLVQVRRDKRGRVIETVQPVAELTLEERLRILLDCGCSYRVAAGLLGRSAAWAVGRRRRIPSRVVPLCGSDPDWRPSVEAVAADPDARETCGRCGGESGPIREGSALVCLACLRSGWDLEIAAERLEDARREVAAAANRARQAERRKAERARRKLAKMG